MHKKLEAELVSLAHQILQMKDKNDVVKLKNKAKEVYEKLSVLDFVNNYFLTAPQAAEDKKEILEKIEKVDFSAKKAKNNLDKKQILEATEEINNKSNDDKDALELAELKKKNQAILKAEAEKIAQKLLEKEKKEAERIEKIRLEAIEAAKKAAEIKRKEDEKLDISKTEDFKDSIPADVAANLFEKASNVTNKPIQPIQKSPETPQKVAPKKSNIVAPPKKETTGSSVNDRVFKGKIQIGLNDRIAFVKHLFNFSQEEFNRVLSQLNSFNSEQEAKDFIINTVQADYNWTGKDEYVERLFMLIERRFA